MAENKYLVSGLGPGPGGVGALMKNLSPTAQKYGFRVVAKWNGPSIRKSLSQRKYVLVAKLLAEKFLRGLQFFLATNAMSGGKVVFLHPQTAGFKTLFRLARKNDLFLYVMDNSFFCIRSYNFHPCEKTECFKCLGNVRNADAECSPFPVAIDRSQNLAWLEQLQRLAPMVTFLCQNDNQSQLLKMHFGEDTHCKVIGMNTGELSQWTPEALSALRQRDENKEPFILFHGAAAEPKGLDYFIRLAARMPNWKFVVPAPRCELASRPLPNNVECLDVTWASGLMELTQNAALVMNPSMWSAPIEGALLKSLAYNPNVATVKTRYGYESEIPSKAGLVRLPQDVSEAAIILEKMLDQEILKSTPQFRIEWLKTLKRSNQFEHFISTL